MFKISLMDHSDLDEAYKIEQLTNPSPWSKANFFSSFDIGHKSLVCKLNEELIGFIIFSLIKKESHLLNIAVIQEWQSNGIGSLLIKYMIRQSKVMGAKKIFLEVRSKNKEAILFYKKFNFIQDALRIGYYSGKNPDDAVLMSLNL
ncbi:MAG: ribosomal-protein-alanine N-acetyltransferase [Gammaproteobacteria bacterium]|nr:ribosomal-protein-alanine N-acetyltransferase [Gammaproteobacteria bacterium]|tara:strand:+ start:434 stop:871 length:438 start_codon:yes stop_codon:yes gene_type:complete